MTVLKTCGQNYRFVLDHAQRSIKEAFYCTPENVIFTMLLLRLVQEAEKTDEYYIIPFERVYTLCAELCKQMFGSKSKVNYLLGYLYAGCKLEKQEDTLVFVCDRKTVDSVLETIS